MGAKDIFANLRSGNPEIVIQSIEEIKEQGTAAHFPYLINLLHETSNPEIKKMIITLFGELKSTSTVPLLMDAIQDVEYKEELKELVSCCWQNGMNYSPYLSVFVDLVISQDFPVALEALTVIENMDGKIDQKIIEQELEKVKQVPVSNDDQKNFLLTSLPTAIKNIMQSDKEFS